MSKAESKGAIFDRDGILNKFKEIADKEYDGCYTLLKSATNWRCSFGTVMHLIDIQSMCCGNTMEEAILKAIDSR